MANILDTFDIEANFWKINPQMNIPEEFASLKKVDKSKDKEVSSRKMWAISLILEPKSKFSNLSDKDRRYIVAKDYLKDKEFDWNSISLQIEAYKRLKLSAAKKQLIEFRSKLEEKTEYLRSVSYGPETWEMIEKMLGSNTKLYQELARLESALEDDNEEGQVKGGVEESLSERGEI